MAADTVQAVKDKLSIVEVVSPYVKLTKAGKLYRGLSPFNKEKTPSFYVNPERGTYYCFSSSQGGDHFTFIEKMEGVDFKGALKLLAEKAGVPLEYTGGNKQQAEKTDRLREAMARAEAFYARNLASQAEISRFNLDKGADVSRLNLDKESQEDGTAPSMNAYEYALSRGLTPETITAWNLGYAPDGWRALLEELSAAGFTTKEMLDAGLIKEADGKAGTYYDRFRNRLMFPIQDAAGRTVAFTGRALSPDDQAKYLNSPETELFKKSQVLFGMHKAKDAIRSRGFALLVEGQFDVILLHQIGFGNAIALSGTAFSREHLSLLSRYSDNLMLALDADRAGLAASAKNAFAALGSGMRVKAVRMPLGKDPADLAKETPGDFARRVQEAEPVIEFFLSVLAASENDQHRLVVAAERTVLPLIAVMKSPMEREHFVQIVARKLGSSPDAVRSSLPRAGAVPEDAVPHATAQASSSAASSREILVRAAIAAYPGSALAKKLSAEYARIIGAVPEEETLPERALFEAGLLFGEAPQEEAGDDLIRALERTILTEQLRDATARLRRHEAAKDDALIKEALADCKAFSDRLAALG